jgi:hypothetical protein
MTAVVSTRMAMPSEIEPADMRVFDHAERTPAAPATGAASVKPSVRCSRTL